MAKYNIWFSQDEHPILSNLHPRIFQYKGLHFLNVEHAYQSIKSGKLNQYVYNHSNWQINRMYKSRDIPHTKNDWNIKLMGRLIHHSLLQNPDIIPYLINPAHPFVGKDKEVEFTHISKFKSEDVWTTQFPRILTIIRNHFISLNKEKNNG